jgi:hypothetical protein
MINLDLKATKLEPEKHMSCLVLAMTILLGVLSPIAKAEENKPIISSLLYDFQRYDGRSVTIYGLVIETAKAGKEFMLQDVSQMPLRVIRNDTFRSFIGDQMLVQGVFFANGGEPYLEARKITNTKVLGGGGCC